jgi:hypothetical protein
MYMSIPRLPRPRRSIRLAAADDPVRLTIIPVERRAEFQTDTVLASVTSLFG